MSTDAAKKKLQTRHADDAIRMAERLPGIMFDLLYMRLGLDGTASTAKQVADAYKISTVECNRLYERAVALVVAAVDSEEVSAEDIPDLLTVGWMRRDDDPVELRPAPEFDVRSREKIDRVLGGVPIEVPNRCVPDEVPTP